MGAKSSSGVEAKDCTEVGGKEVAKKKRPTIVVSDDEDSEHSQSVSEIAITDNHEKETGPVVESGDENDPVVEVGVTDGETNVVQSPPSA
ncbi:unnamed protein product [Arabis nemorensis]|uniref:Uncharacterized protein n=1 Tax=Arabis nemorensis TaxID=586526 RepID=A0A565BMG9_9BRAS|nr:unnamed protein product [Arabis nemorensis]